MKTQNENYSAKLTSRITFIAIATLAIALMVTGIASADFAFAAPDGEKGNNAGGNQGNGGDNGNDNNSGNDDSAGDNDNNAGGNDNDNSGNQGNGGDNGNDNNNGNDDGDASEEPVDEEPPIEDESGEDNTDSSTSTDDEQSEDSTEDTNTSEGDAESTDSEETSSTEDESGQEENNGAEGSGAESDSDDNSQTPTSEEEHDSSEESGAESNVENKIRRFGGSNGNSSRTQLGWCDAECMEGLIEKVKEEFMDEDGSVHVTPVDGLSQIPQISGDYCYWYAFYVKAYEQATGQSFYSLSGYQQATVLIVLGYNN